MHRGIKHFVIATVILLLSAIGVYAEKTSLIYPLAHKSLLLDVVKAGDRLIAVGERGHVIVSDDQGKNWTQKQAPTRSTLNKVFFVDDKTGWVVGHDATILRTDDAGDSWQLQYMSADLTNEYPIFDVWFADKNIGFVVGGYALNMVTTDGGQSWLTVTFEPLSEEDVMAGEESMEGDEFADDEFEDFFESHLNDVAVDDAGNLYVAGEMGAVLRSADQGATWESLPSPYDGSFFGVLALPENVVLAYGLRGNMFRSADGGQSWVPVDTHGIKVLLSSGLLLDDGTVLVAGGGGVVLVSKDMGQTFELQKQKDGLVIAGMVEVQPGRVLSSGARGTKFIDLSGSL